MLITTRLARMAGICMAVILTSASYLGWAMGFSVPASLEEVVQSADLIVLGTVTRTDLDATEIRNPNLVVTRHTLSVESYFLGTGVDEIVVVTLGGYLTKTLAGQERRIHSQVPGSVQVRDGEEILAFLRKGPEGYYFVADDGSKYSVETGKSDDERWVSVRLRKKRYMRGKTLAHFESLEAMQGGENPSAAVEATLVGPKYLTERVPLEELFARISEIAASEKLPPIRMMRPVE